MPQDKSKRFRLFLLGFLSVNGLWLVFSFILNEPIVPNPLDVYPNLPRLLEDQVWLHVGYSLFRIGAAVFLAMAVGIPIGIVMAYSKRIFGFLNPFIYFSYPIPKSALLPVIMLLLGMRDASKITVIFLILVFQVVVSARSGVEQIDRSMYQVIRSTGASRWEVIRHVTLPAVLPNLLTSTRIALGTSLSVLFFIEGYGTRYGMGYYILDAWSRIQYVQMYLGIVVLAMVGFLLFLFMDWLESVLCAWNR